MDTGRSFLLQTAQIPEEVLDKFSRIDRLVVDASSIDVKSLRAVVALASQQALGDKRLLAIENGDQLSDQMQNTLLKLLEEPPSTLVVVIQTLRPQALLPTVRSRLHSLTVDQRVAELSSIEVPGVKELKSIVEKAKDRAALASAIEAVLAGLRGAILESPTEELIQAVNLLDRTIRRLGQNANQKLVIDSLLLNWPLQSSRSE